jgi:ABC-type branched-subunit amino acid transport system ATPase component
MELVMGISDRILAMDAGEPIAIGTAAEIRNDPKVIAAYLGEGATSAKPRGEALATSETPVLETLKLTAGYGAAPVLRSVSMKVRPGEMVALLGANGAGKSTFLSALSGLLRPVEGAIVLSDEAIQWKPPHSIVEQGLILVPEGRQVFPELTARENIELGAYKRGAAVEAGETDAILERFPRLRDRLDTQAGLLSGGEQQMMAIARGLMAKPKVPVRAFPVFRAPVRSAWTCRGPSVAVQPSRRTCAVRARPRGRALLAGGSRRVRRAAPNERGEPSLARRAARVPRSL